MAKHSKREERFQPNLSQTPFRRHTPRSAFEVFVWPFMRNRKQTGKVEIIVRDPSAAHGYLLRSAELQRHWFYPSLAGPNEHVDILVVGAGLAGLTAAYSLQPRKCTVLEIGDRIGGTAASYEGMQGYFPLGAHYEHDPAIWFGSDLIGLYQNLDLVEKQPTGLLYRFLDKNYYVNEDRCEQHFAVDGTLNQDPWTTIETGGTRSRVIDLLRSFLGKCTLPSRLTPSEIRVHAGHSFRDWMREQRLSLDPMLQSILDTGLRSDYGAPSKDICAFAGIHYLTCRPYITSDVPTFSPPNGLSYFADRLIERTTNSDVRTSLMVRHIKDHRDHVEVLALDLKAKRTRRFIASQVIVASSKKSLKYLFPKDAPLFINNMYAAWITVTMEMKRFPEKDMLYWGNGIQEPSQVYVGVVWANHFQPDEVPVLTHYLTFAPGRWNHFYAYLARPYRLVDFCLEQLRRLIGRDVSSDLERVIIQKLGHAMPTPVPGSLFFEPNERRSSERVVYAGVDTGRLPILAEAFDSGLEAARYVREVS